jgi:hypothetical protein
VRRIAVLLYGDYFITQVQWITDVRCCDGTWQGGSGGGSGAGSEVWTWNHDLAGSVK